MFKLAIFDLDGTLLNTLDDLAAACNYALAASGFPPHAASAYKMFVGRGVHLLISSILPEQNRDEKTVERVRSDFMEYYTEHAEDLTEPYGGVLDMLEALINAGVNTAVLSNKPHLSAVVLCKSYFPGLIGIAFGQREGVPLKPDPTVPLEIMRHFGAKPEETIYIGDTGVDIQTGKNAGFYTVGVTWGFRSRQELLENGADLVVDDADVLAKIIVDK